MYRSLPLATLDLRSSAEGSGTFNVISVQTRRRPFVAPISLLPLSCTISPRKARPVIAKTENIPFLIERTNFVQSGNL